jgi:hypothetical protein
MEELIKIIADNGISVTCVCFLMYYILVVQRDTKLVLQNMITAINEMNKTLISICAIIGIKENVESIKDKIEK